MLVRKRFGVKSPGQVTGYSVALPGDTAKDGGLVWYGGGESVRYFVRGVFPCPVPGVYPEPFSRAI